MIYKSISRRAFSLWLLVAGLEGLLAAYFIVREPSEAENVLAFGLSSQRLFIFIGVISFSLFFVIVAIAHFYRFISWNEILNKKPKLLRFTLTGTVVLGILILHLLFLLPEYLFPTLSGYLFRLRPVLIWLVLVFAQTFIFLAYFGAFHLKDLKEWRIHNPAMIIFLMIGVIWGYIAITGTGITPNEFYWNMAGVPLLAWQIWASIGVTLLVWFLYSRFVRNMHFSRLTSLVVFIGIWVVAAIIWIGTPLAPTFNAPGPYLPSKEFYPFVDAALFDLGAQSAIYGKGFFFGSFFDRILVTGLLAITHMMFGQNYLVAVSVQSVVYAVFPALLYLLGKKMHSKSAGIMIASLAILKVSNAIAGGKWISTSHPKLMLTEVPTGITLVLISIFFVSWINSDKSKVYNLAGIGSLIGVGIMLRTNVFFMIPVFLILGLKVWKPHWNYALRDVLIVSVAFFITISPWMWRNQQVAGEPLFFIRKFYNVIDERYEPQSHLYPKKSVSSFSPRALKAGIVEPQTTIDDFLDQYQFVSRHFLHNLVTSVLILPPSPVLDDLRHVVEIYPYWDRIANPWQGQISGSMTFFIAINLLILSIGFGATWRRAGFVSLVPLAVFLFYNLANAFARTSGGRYIVPVDWVIYFYYAIGLVEIIRFCISKFGFHPGDFFDSFRNQEHDGVDGKFKWRKVVLTILPFFLMIAALPVIELASPGDKPPETIDSLMQRLDEVAFFERSDLPRSQVEEFLSDPDAILTSGRGFYPRYYSYNEGEPILPGQMTAYTARDFPRLVFSLLLPDLDKTVVLPIDEPRLHFPDTVEVIVGGCQMGQSVVLASYYNYIDAAFIVILDETESIYVRVPEAPLSCPIRKPICDDNHNCN